MFFYTVLHSNYSTVLYYTINTVLARKLETEGVLTREQKVLLLAEMSDNPKDGRAGGRGGELVYA